MSSQDRVGQQMAALLSAAGEQDIRRRLANLLAELDAGEYSLEVRAGTGAADLVCHEYRVVIETKARGEAGPAKLRTGTTETQFGQVARYVEAFADRRLDLGGQRPWRGFLTDGRAWWGWEWQAPAAGESSGADNLVALRHVQGVVFTDDLDAFRQFVVEHLAPPERRGAPAPPSPLRKLFDPFLAELRVLLPTVETEPFYETKFGLWRRTLQGSGLVGPGAIGQAHNFAEHTMLVVAARMIVLAAQDGSAIDELPKAVADGFCAWLGDFDAGIDLLERLANSVSQYDWRAADRDLLKELYHDLIDRDDRKEFGEYYTPDWLAADVVDQVLVKDPARLDAAIGSAARTLETESASDLAAERAFSILDPACGSGTFLFWSARAVAKRIRSTHPLLVGRTREIVAVMVTGLDVHPVAVEMAKATLATALPPGAAVPLRVYLADALLHSEQAQKNLEGTLGLTSAQGQRIDIPAAVIESPHADLLVRTLVDAAVGERSLAVADAETQAMLSGAVAQLSDAVADEGDHVWRWYIGNQVAPSALARNKVMAIVANPPWLVANDTPAGMRKDQLATLSERYGLRPRARWSAKGDLASVFSARATDLYLEDGGSFGLVLPGSALINQTWKAWRSGNWGATRVGFDYVASLDDVEPPPFRHAPNGTCVVVGRRLREGAPEWDDAMLLRYSGDPEIPTVTKVERRESRPSPYARRFRRGAVASPLGLCLVVDPIQPGHNDTVTVRTKASTKLPWKGVSYETVVETTALVRTLRAQTLAPFVCSPDAWLIAPLSKDRRAVMALNDAEFRSSLPRTHEYWTIAEARYARDRAKTAGTTLSENVDFQRTLTNQLAAGASEHKCKVFYNKSGDSLRACRGPARLVADDKSYWFVAASVEEALYLTGVLNAECLQDAWRESKTSKLHFDTNPLKHVPVPAFDPDSALHARIVRAAREAERRPTAPRAALTEAVAEMVPDYATLGRPATAEC
ncbi:hypothetical protein [Candidatus Poriferisodalis sp.]|uniref:hypothetical protein n=1 Tax=Candidatus Poriferisodalis sp. TaxID=3101277 RepID=UPI003AF463C0